MAKRLYCADIEGDDLLDGITKVWCASFTELNPKMEELQSFTHTEKADYLPIFQDPDAIIVMHNGIAYDGPALTKVHGIKIEAEIIDTLFLSWYLYPKMARHGLAVWGEELGISKPTIDDWENLSLEEYIHRCKEDVRIQTALWKQMWKHLWLLYGNVEGCWKIIRHLNLKARYAALKESAKWKLDVEATSAATIMFDEKVNTAVAALSQFMPDVPEYAKRKPPAKPFLLNGELSVTGRKWDALTKEHGFDFSHSEPIKVIKGYRPPNAGAHGQLKSWLFSLGWEPTIYKHQRNKVTNEMKVIPQVRDKDSGDLCLNIQTMMLKMPELHHLGELSVVKHRLSFCQGLEKNVDENGYVVAGIQGLTNTLRYKHKTCVNIPSLRKPYGKLLRSLFQARSEGTELCGSDMCSLEDRTKQHFMWEHDPEYVKDMMTEGFDPHLDMALAASMITPADAAFYRNFDKDTASEADHKSHAHIALQRHGGKSCNYAATYGAKGPTIARAAGLEELAGDKLYDAYWTRNWSINAIADSCIVKKSRGMMWLWNPIAELWYFLKAEKDRFSTLNQGTATYAFDRWVWHMLERREQLTADFHDEVILELKVGFRAEMTKILKDSVAEVNKELKLNRDLDVDIDFGRNYSEIH